MPPPDEDLLLTEGHTVCTLIYGRIALMGTNQDAIQRAKIGIGTVVCALGNGTFNTLICVAIHRLLLLSDQLLLVCHVPGFLSFFIYPLTCVFF